MIFGGRQIGALSFGLRAPRRLAMRCLAAGLLVLSTWLVASSHRGLSSPVPSQLLLDRRSRYLGEVPAGDDSFGYWPVPYALPSRIARATIETEDRHFYDHPGVNLRSVARAFLQDVRHLTRISGASTLAMQVARMQSPESRSLLHKLREAFEALWLVHDFGHEKVLRQYLTIAPYGNRVHGIVRASRLYFDKPAEDLSWLQAAYLAGLPQAPARMNPYEPAGRRRGLERAHRILRMLRARGYITETELAQALESDLGLIPRQTRAPDALHAVLALQDKAREHGGTTLRATLDLDIQHDVATILKRNLARIAGNDASNTAAMVVDPRTGEVLAHVGSNGYFDAADHGAMDFVQVKRSPGSALKPFIYALALESGQWTAGSEIADTRADYSADEEGGAYVPENYNHAFLGPMLLRNALGNSRNIPALRVLASVGVEPALHFFDAAGVEDISWDSESYGLGLAIGNLEVTLDELARLYLVLADGGVARPLREFTDEAPTDGKRLLREDVAQLVTHILSDPLARRPSFPAGGPLDFDDMAVAIKTGTSQGHRDAWTAAYTDRLLVVVWVGNHDRRRMRNVTGATAAGEAVHAILDKLMPGREPYRPIVEEFPAPPSYTKVSICPLSGKLAGPDCPDAKAEVFAPGTEPVDHCGFHHKVRLDRRNGLRAGPGCPQRMVVERPMVDLPRRYREWARSQHLEVAPERFSPLCPAVEDPHPSIAIREPHDRERFLWDPETPAESSGIRLAAEVAQTDEEIVWIVDGSPVAEVPYPYELTLSLQPGKHTILASMARSDVTSKAVTITVAN